MKEKKKEKYKPRQKRGITIFHREFIKNIISKLEFIDEKIS
jgi:hypothetical protein